MTTHELYVALGAGAAIVLVAVFAVRLAVRAGLPSLLLYLALGMVVGKLWIPFDDPALAQSLGLAALVVILAEGGLTTRWSSIRSWTPAAASLATVGVAVSVAVTAVAVWSVMDVDWRTAFVVGAVLAPTDSAAVFSVLRRLRLPPNVTGLLEAESGFNDAPVVLLVVALAGEGHEGLGWLPALIAAELAIGAAVGLAVGWAAVMLLRRVALPASGLYPLAVSAITVGSYAAAGLAHGSGFLAVYLTGLYVGNADLPHRRATRGFVEGLAWLSQIGLFVMLGLLVTPGQLPSAIAPALVIGGVLLLFARPFSVIVAAAPFRVPPHVLAFASWAGLRGAVPIVLATIPRTLGLPGAVTLFNVVFVIVIMLTLLQGPTLPAVARWLAISQPAEPADLEVETAPLEQMHADLLQLHVPDGSHLHGVEVTELRLPRGAVVTLILRDGQGFVPDPYVRVLAGDDLLIVATAGVRDRTEQRLRAVSRAGRLAGWRGERGQA